ncbi:hypothetical protein QAD02_011733 [Eretmocerus hayati]|uniref:Uncharacterized protein n=1 Tax=Eretmocerus hayati TaxID=131215 RepID=A0ACC2NXV1_9HYME|nr:hypothetical protein QAD02_011733 [Eretmocerus hayati]
MPKIFLIKNRLHQQQLRLQQLEAQGHLGKLSPGPHQPSPLVHGKHSPLGNQEPLSLIVNKHQCEYQWIFMWKSPYLWVVPWVRLENALGTRGVEVQTWDFGDFHEGNFLFLEH